MTDPEIRSCADARKLGLTQYFTGKPCQYGHVSKRSTSGHHCLECQRAYDVRRRADIRAGLRPPRKAYKGAVRRQPPLNPPPLTPEHISIMQKYADGIRVVCTRRLLWDMVGRAGARTLTQAIANGIRRGIID